MQAVSHCLVVERIVLVVSKGMLNRGSEQAPSIPFRHTGICIQVYTVGEDESSAGGSHNTLPTSGMFWSGAFSMVGVGSVCVTSHLGNTVCHWGIPKDLLDICEQARQSYGNIAKDRTASCDSSTM
jgi:hypothetical protein